MRNKIADQPNLVKDTNSKAVLNVSKDSLNSYKIQREKIKKTFDVVKEVAQLKEDMVEIKSLLKQILQGQ